MITEEQLKKVLNSLRLNIYDTPAYKIDSWCDKYCASIRIESTETKNCLSIYLHKHKSKWLFGRQWFWKLRHPIAIVERFTIGGNGTSNKIEISKELYDDFFAFINERNCEEQFIAETNVNQEFNL